MKARIVNLLDSGALPTGFAVWGAALILLIAAFSTAAMFSGINENAVGYMTCAVLFISAMISGKKASGKSESGKIITAVSLSLLIVICCLTTGFAVSGELNTSSVIKVVAFTVSGCLSGSILTLKKHKGKHIKIKA